MDRAAVGVEATAALEAAVSVASAEAGSQAVVLEEVGSEGFTKIIFSL